jgi:chemotaxis protein MotA
MDVATILGLVTGLVMVIAAMLLGGEALPFMHVPSLLITFGGTLSAVLIHFPARQVWNGFAVARNCFVSRLSDPAAVVARFRGFALRARREGLLALETAAAEEADPFLRLGLELTASGCEKAALKAALQREASAIDQRHLAGRRLFEVMASTAPAWGIIGTLIGLVQMLRSLDDPRQIGSGLAVALLTTLYGALFANLFCLPLAGKLETRHMEEAMIRELMSEGFLALHEEHSPGLIEDRLRAWVPPQQRSDTVIGQSRAA